MWYSGRRFRISSAALLRQVRLCFARTGREILNSNPAERLDEHPFIHYYLRLGSTVFPLSLVLSGRRIANHVLVFSICTISKLIVVFVCKAFLHYTPLWRFYVIFLYISWFVPCQLHWNKQINRANTLLNQILNLKLVFQKKIIFWLLTSISCGFSFPALNAIESGRVYCTFKLLTCFASFCHLEQTISARTTINTTCAWTFYRLIELIVMEAKLD